jgi:biotin carboxyl carrier protein
VYVLKTPPPSYVATSEKKQADPSSVTAPMTGRIDRVLVTLGQKVKKDTPLAIMEAMKMEVRWCCPIMGVAGHYQAFAPFRFIA